MSVRTERILIRIFVSIGFCVALSSAAFAPTPALPAVALGQPGLYRLEVALLIFYGSLLLITPVLSGLICGRLPIEISTRGAKFAEEDDRSAGLDEVTIRNLEGTTDDLAQALADARIEIEQLNEIAGSDNTQRRIDSRE